MGKGGWYRVEFVLILWVWDFRYIQISVGLVFFIFCDLNGISQVRVSMFYQCLENLGFRLQYYFVWYYGKVNNIFIGV